MVIKRRIAHHFLPHFYADPHFADAAAALDRNLIHHRAHALSLSALFAYLQILVISVSVLYFITARTPQILGQLTFSADQIISLTNREREKNGLTVLIYSPLLAQAAQAKAADMHQNNYWAHNSPSGTTPWSFITAAGYKYVFAGENLARDFTNPQDAVEAWTNSPSHRSNLLDKNFKEIGVGIENGRLTGREGILVVQMFGTSVQGLPTSSAESAISQPVAAARTPEGTLAPAAQIAASPPTQVAVLAGRQFAIAKGISLALVGFIFALFLLEVLITAKRAEVSLRPGVLAHLAILGFVLFTVWYAVGGAIL